MEVENALDVVDNLLETDYFGGTVNHPLPGKKTWCLAGVPYYRAGRAILLSAPENFRAFADWTRRDTRLRHLNVSLSANRFSCFSPLHSVTSFFSIPNSVLPGHLKNKFLCTSIFPVISILQNELRIETIVKVAIFNNLTD